MGYILEASGGFHWKAHSSVDITNGQPLGSTIKSRRPLRRQQSVLLARKNETYPSKSHWRVQELAAAKAKEIEAWEKASHDESRDTAPNPDITVSEFYTTVYLPWLETHVKTGQKAYATLVSIKRYWKAYLSEHFNGTKTFKNYQPYLGSQFLQDLRRENGEPYGESTIKQIHSTASGIFAKAILEGYTDYKVNPWHAIPIKDMVFINAEQGEAFKEKDVETMIANLEGDRNGRDDWNVQLAQCVLAVGIWAGLRPSEIAALQWQSVDLGTATLTVRKAYVYGKEKATTKTGKERVVPFRDKLVPVLRAWWEVNGRPESGWVFPNRDGNPVNMNILSDRIIRPNCEKTGLPWDGFAFYALRRGCLSTLVQAGWSCEQVAQFAGNSREVVWNHYFVDKKGELALDAREQERERKQERADRLALSAGGAK